MTNENLPNRNRDKYSMIFKNIQSYEDWHELISTDFSYKPRVSMVSDVYSKPEKHLPIREIYNIIKEGTYKETIDKIRSIDDSDKRKELKKKLPAVLFGGIFKNERTSLASSSQLICLDFDKVEDIGKKVFRLRFSPYIYMMFVSPSGNGLKLIVRAEVEDKESYKEKANQLFEYFEPLGLKADTSKQNITDLCYVSYDPNAFINESATFWRKINFLKEYPDSNEDEIVKSVEFICKQIEENEIDITIKYEDWLNIGFALCDQFGIEGIEYFQRISKYYEEYTPEKCEKQYDYCLHSRGSGITVRTLFQIAKDYGLQLIDRTSVAIEHLDQFDKDFYTGEELLRRSLFELPTLVNPILPKVGLVALGGSSDVGKSSFLRQLAINISTGSDEFLGFKINSEHGKVIYVSSEDDDNAIGFLLQIQNEKLKLPSSSYDGIGFLVDTSDTLNRLESLLNEQPADLVIIDTFSDLFTGEMNQVNRIRSYLNKYSDLAKKYQCLVMMLHHTGKRTEGLPPSKNNLLGSQGFEAKMRLVLELRKDISDEDIRHLCVVKANYLSKEYKEQSYSLTFNSNMLFEFTGERVSFDKLVPNQKDKAEEEKIWIEKAEKYKEDGKTYEQIEEILKEDGFNVSKSTIQRKLSQQK